MQHVVRMADLKISTVRDDVLITYALGSCLGITVYDPVTCVGGLLHVMLPLSTIDLVKAQNNPCVFVDTGVPRLFQACYSAGAKKERLVVKVAGGACLSKAERDPFQIGRQNFTILRKLLWKNGVLLQSFDVGGGVSRTMLLELKTGTVRLRINGDEVDI